MNKMALRDQYFRSSLNWIEFSYSKTLGLLKHKVDKKKKDGFQTNIAFQRSVNLHCPKHEDVRQVSPFD